MRDRHETSAIARPVLRLSAVGFAATAIAFGPARMGFGLFLPNFRREFDLSTTTAGLIASGGFFTYLLALPVAAWLADRIGQRAPVVAGAVSAASGLAVVAGAIGIGALAVGVALAGASAGFCWTPFNDAAKRVLPRSARSGALSAISTGTAAGIALTSALALAVSFGALHWRALWGASALAGLAVAIAASLGLPGGVDRTRECRSPAAQRLARWEVLPLYSAALIFGATNAVYISFAADRVVAAGGLPGIPADAASAIIFLGYGAFGLIGLATGWIEARIGLSALLAGIFAAFAVSLALVGLAPRQWAGVIASAGLHGGAVMTVSAALSFWSLRLFPDHGSLGFSAALVAGAIGAVFAPALAGPLVAGAGPQAAFLIMMAPAMMAALFFAFRGVQNPA